MYNYEKILPKGFKVEKEISKGSSAKVFILINKNDNKIVRKISNVEGINKNGKAKLRKEIIFLEYFHTTKTNVIYPQIYRYECNDSYVYYDMSFIEGLTLEELINEDKKDNILDCCNKIITDLCTYSFIRKPIQYRENTILYRFYINKTKSVLNKLEKDPKVSNMINNENIVINNAIYKNVKSVINYLYTSELQNKLISNTISFCFHGDLISSNILYNNGNVNYIDPRGDLGNFDICYDVAKMKFSFSGYDQVNNNKIILSEHDGSINFKLEDKTYEFINNSFFTILRKNEYFSDGIIKQDGYWKERIMLHTALQYINNSYIQLEKGNLDKFKIMYSIGVIKLNELLNRLY